MLEPPSLHLQQGRPLGMLDPSDGSAEHLRRPHGMLDPPSLHQQGRPMGMLDPSGCKGVPGRGASLIVCTANCTSWTSAKKYVQKTKAHLLLLQELKLRGDELAEASQWLGRNSWKSILAEAGLGPMGEPSAGVGILVRDWMGLGPCPVVLSRAMCWWSIVWLEASHGFLGLGTSSPMLDI